MNPSTVTKTAITLVSGMSAVALAVAATVAFAEPIETENRIAPSISFAQAMELASGAANGTLAALELEHSGDKPVYVAELESPTSHTELRIDGMSGDILGTNTISASSPEALHAMFAAQDHGCHGGDEHGDNDHEAGDEDRDRSSDG